MISMLRRGVKPEQRKEPAINRELKRFNDITAQSRLIPQVKSIDELTPEQIIEIAGLGEIFDELDGRPLEAKLREALEKGCCGVVADALDDEPYVSSRLVVFARFREQVVSGLRLCGKALGLEKSALSAAVYQGLMTFGPRIPDGEDVKVKRYNGKYPVDLPVRSAGEASGILYLGTGALLHLHRAVFEMRRQTTAFVTLAGDCISNPFNAELPLEMPVQRALDFCGLSDDPSYICVGGSMTAKPVLDPERTFVVPDTRAILAFHRYDHVEPAPCIGCGRCMAVCPQKLPVFYLYQASVHKQLSVLRRMDLERCLSCGACSYICPSRLDIVEALQKGEKMLHKRREQVARLMAGESQSLAETPQPVVDGARPDCPPEDLQEVRKL